MGSARVSASLEAGPLSLVDMGRSGKLPSGVSAKLKRWKKGHSSDSNPAICRHRQAARSRFFSRPSGSRIETWARSAAGFWACLGLFGSGLLWPRHWTFHLLGNVRSGAVVKAHSPHLTNTEPESTVGNDHRCKSWNSWL